MSTETLEAPAAEAAEPETQTAPEPAPGAEVAVRPYPGFPAMSAKMAYAKMLAVSGLLPAAYREQPANVLYAVEYGEMLGLPPMAAINGIHVIEGKPTASAALISALVRRAGHKLRVKGDDKQATAQIVRADDPDFTFEATWDLTRAAAAGLTGKGTWKKYPAAMLKARAITEAARDACEEALCGMHYTPEELGAEVTEEGEPLQWAPVAEDPSAEWIRQTTAEADGFATDDDGRDLWKKVAGKVNAGEITKGAGGAIQAVIKARWHRLAVQAQEAADAEPVEGVIVDTPAGDGDEWTQAIADAQTYEDAERLLGDLERSQVSDDRRAVLVASISDRMAGLECPA